MEEGGVPAPGTRIRAQSLPLPGGEAASLHHVDGQKLALACMKGENAANIQGNNREGGEVTTNNGEESPLQGTRLSCKFNMLALNGVHIAIMGSFPHLK